MAISLLKKKDVDMTVGSIPKLILGFFFPMVFGLLLQQLYNAVDMIIVGQFASSQSMGAVGGTGSITNAFVLFCSGISVGAGVIISQYYGNHDSENIKKAVSSSIWLAVIMSIAITILGMALTKPLLLLMKSNEDIIGYATTYLLIYFGGVSGLIFYNMLTSILRAVGDSTRPLIYLVIRSVLNIILDLLFVAVFKWDVAGAAIATIISQFVSALCAFIYLARIDADYKIDLKNLELDKKITKTIVLVGLPAGIQSSITGFSNTFIHSYINVFGSSYESGFSVYIKLDQFIMVVQTAFGFGITSFVGQNVGANKIRRACKGTTFTLFACLVGSAMVILPLTLFSSAVTSLFTQDIAVNQAAAYIITFLTPFHIFLGINTVYMAALRGDKKTKASMFINVGAFVGFRLLYLFVVSNVFVNQLLPVILCFPIGWFIGALLHTITWFTSPIVRANRILKRHPEGNGLSVKEVLEWKKNGFPQLLEQKVA